MSVGKTTDIKLPGTGFRTVQRRKGAGSSLATKTKEADFKKTGASNKEPERYFKNERQDVQGYQRQVEERTGENGLHHGSQLHTSLAGLLQEPGTLSFSLGAC